MKKPRVNGARKGLVVLAMEQLSTTAQAGAHDPACVIGAVRARLEVLDPSVSDQTACQMLDH